MLIIEETVHSLSEYVDRSIYMYLEINIPNE